MCTHLYHEVCRVASRFKHTDAPWQFGYTLTNPVVEQPRKINMLSVKVVAPAKPWSRTTVVDFPIYASPNTPEAEVIMAPDLDVRGTPNPLPDGVRKWFEDCRSHHDGCADLRKVALPTRLLDTLPSADDSEAVCLHVSRQGEVGEYAALSYCWGDVKDRFVVTSVTLNAFTKSIKWASMHKTYQHAIMVCRKLGIRYLWIDAVCILQDKDDIDKATEMPRMHQYYKNAAVVISAADATHANAGFLIGSETGKGQDGTGEEAKSWHRSRKVQGWSPSGVAILLTICTTYDVYQPEKLAIESRAWTLQERLLSTRILQFLCNGSIT